MMRRESWVRANASSMTMTMMMSRAVVSNAVVRRGEGRRSSRTMTTRARRGVVVMARGGGDAASMLADGRAMYERGERMNGFKTFERALDGGDGTMTAETRRELCYCAMCCSAAFGDVETAKMYLREMQAYGLDFEMAIADPRLMKMESSALMKNQLKKFAAGEGKSFGTVQRERYERDQAAKGPGPAPTSVKGLRDLDISSDTDESVEAIVGRVAALIALSVVGFAALFAAGMQVMEPGSLPFEEVY